LFCIAVTDPSFVLIFEVKVAHKVVSNADLFAPMGKSRIMQRAREYGKSEPIDCPHCDINTRISEIISVMPVW
jgi:hypothetical protein